MLTFTVAAGPCLALDAGAHKNATSHRALRFNAIHDVRYMEGKSDDPGTDDTGGKMKAERSATSDVSQVRSVDVKI